MCRQMMHKQLLFSMQFVRVSRTTVVGQDAVDAVHQQVEVEALFYIEPAIMTPHDSILPC